MVLDLLTNPDDFFERRAANPGYLRPALVVLAVAVVNVLGVVPTLQATLDALPPEIGALGLLLQAITAVVTLLTVLVTWLLYALAFFAVAKLAFDGDGGFGETLAVTGWGFVPALFGAAINAAATVYVFSGVTFPSNPAQVQQFAAELQGDPVLLAAGLLGIVFLLWSAFLWTFAVRHVQSIDLRSAAITVAVPVAFGLLLRLWGVVGGL